eukprot:gene3146-3988_t
MSQRQNPMYAQEAGINPMLDGQGHGISSPPGSPSPFTFPNVQHMMVNKANLPTPDLGPVIQQLQAVVGSQAQMLKAVEGRNAGLSHTMEQQQLQIRSLEQALSALKEQSRRDIDSQQQKLQREGQERVDDTLQERYAQLRTELAGRLEAQGEELQQQMARLSQRLDGSIHAAVERVSSEQEARLSSATRKLESCVDGVTQSSARGEAQLQVQLRSLELKMEETVQACAKVEGSSRSSSPPSRREEDTGAGLGDALSGALPDRKALQALTKVQRELRGEMEARERAEANSRMALEAQRVALEGLQARMEELQVSVKQQTEGCQTDLNEGLGKAIMVVSAVQTEATEGLEEVRLSVRELQQQLGEGLGKAFAAVGSVHGDIDEVNNEMIEGMGAARTELMEGLSKAIGAVGAVKEEMMDLLAGEAKAREAALEEAKAHFALVAAPGGTGGGVTAVAGRLDSGGRAESGDNLLNLERRCDAVELAVKARAREIAALDERMLKELSNRGSEQVLGSAAGGVEKLRADVQTSLSKLHADTQECQVQVMSLKPVQARCDLLQAELEEVRGMAGQSAAAAGRHTAKALHEAKKEREAELAELRGSLRAMGEQVRKEVKREQEARNSAVGELHALTRVGPTEGELVARVTQQMVEQMKAFDNSVAEELRTTLSTLVVKQDALAGALEAHQRGAGASESSTVLAELLERFVVVQQQVRTLTEGYQKVDDALSQQSDAVTTQCGKDMHAVSPASDYLDGGDYQYSLARCAVQLAGSRREMFSKEAAARSQCIQRALEQMEAQVLERVQEDVEAAREQARRSERQLEQRLSSRLREASGQGDLEEAMAHIEAETARVTAVLAQVQVELDKQAGAAAEGVAAAEAAQADAHRAHVAARELYERYTEEIPTLQEGAGEMELRLEELRQGLLAGEEAWGTKAEQCLVLAQDRCTEVEDGCAAARGEVDVLRCVLQQAEGVVSARFRTIEQRLQAHESDKEGGQVAKQQREELVGLVGEARQKLGALREHVGRVETEAKQEQGALWKQLERAEREAGQERGALQAQLQRVEQEAAERRSEQAVLRAEVLGFAGGSSQDASTPQGAREAEAPLDPRTAASPSCAGAPPGAARGPLAGGMLGVMRERVEEMQCDVTSLRGQVQACTEVLLQKGMREQVEGVVSEVAAMKDRVRGLAGEVGDVQDQLGGRVAALEGGVGRQLVDEGCRVLAATLREEAGEMRAELTAQAQAQEAMMEVAMEELRGSLCQSEAAMRAELQLLEGQCARPRMDVLGDTNGKRLEE